MRCPERQRSHGRICTGGPSQRQRGTARFVCPSSIVATINSQSSDRSSLSMNSPPLRVVRACKSLGVIVSLRKSTEPSANPKFVPLG